MAKGWFRHMPIAHVVPQVLLTALIAAVPFGAAQAKWPERPVKIVLPFGAGGVADVTARIMAEKLSEKFGERVVIENMPGPGGINAARTVLSASPDGYTLGYVTSGTAISVAAFKALPFDPVKEFELVSMAGRFDLVFAVRADSDYTSLGDFVAAAKAQPGRLNIGTITVGGTQNLGAELFKSLADVQAQIITYRNSPEVVVALLRDDVQMLIEFPPAIHSQVVDKKLRLLASSSAPKRSALMPDLPTAEEAGVKGYEVSGWNGVFAPKGTPKEVIEAMRAAMHEVLARPDVQEQFAKLGVEAHPSSADELMQRLTTDINKWNDVITKAGIARK